MNNSITKREAAAVAWNLVATAAGANLVLATTRGMTDHWSDRTGGFDPDTHLTNCGAKALGDGPAVYANALCLTFGAVQSLGRLTAGLIPHTYKLGQSLLTKPATLPVSSPTQHLQGKGHRRIIWALTGVEASLSMAGHIAQATMAFQNCNPAAWPLVANGAMVCLAALGLTHSLGSMSLQGRVA